MTESSHALRYLAEHAHYTEDLALWRAAAEQAGDPVLDIGCAAGRVALELAIDGRRVVALDADPAMLRALAANAARAGSEASARITTVCADMRTFALDAPVALAIAAMNTLQVLLTSEDQLACLAQIRANLAPEGEFWFDVSMPDIGEVEGAIGVVRAGDVVDDPDRGVRLAHAFWYDWVDPITQTAQFTHRIDEISHDGTIQVFFRHHEVHLFSPVELRHLLARAGFEVLQVWGDFAGAPLEGGAERQVYRCRVTL
jgi:SAM-dependent methyltransferase